MIEDIKKPWGDYKTFFRDENCVFKVITINPGHAISYQIHKERDETWFIKSGSGQLKLAPPGPNPLTNYSIEELAPGDLIQIPRHYAHQVTSIGSEPLVIYEMQTGLTDESDIERLVDPYGR